MRGASSIPGELIPRAREWLDPGITPCVKTSSQVCVASQFAGRLIKRFIEGADRNQATLLPECLDDWVDESNPVRVVDAFVDALDLKQLSFEGMVPEVTGRPSYHPSALLKLYIYGYLNRVASANRTSSICPKLTCIAARLAST